MKTSPDLIAELKYRKSSKGGRNIPVKSGYRPTIKFKFSEQQISGQQIFIGKEIVFPGDTVFAEITMFSPHFYENKLEKGTEFEFREGGTIIGTGKVVELKNKMLELKKSST